ncbi:ComF family protein [Actinoplanes awajinensis]|uniref:ComF family protein n=1 Tax=Actinoplanes awajinensis TaxID=135946 RepID=UPI0012F749CE|nr:ComF family protein [Actinoplanes awajinensis]
MAAISLDSAPLRDPLRAFKYDGQYRWGAIFGRLILGWLDRNAPVALAYTHIVANPGYLNRRPYRHVESMLTAAATEDIHHRWPIYPKALIKSIDTPKSAGQSLLAKSRAAQEHAAAIRLADPPDAAPPLPGARVLIIDDIFTTGTQLDAVGRRFLESGATRVDGLVLARRPWGS